MKGMEPKLIKEENAERDNSGYGEAPRTRSKATCKDRCKTPDSPEGARQAPTAPLSPTQSSPPRHPSVTNGTTSPINNGSADSVTPPLPTSAALSVNLDPVSLGPQQYNPGSYSSTSITRPLVKVKRFLSTLVQFGNDIGVDIGERVRSLVLNLVSSNLSTEEFHHSLQDVTNFPLRPFVLPFLRTHLPLLQREIHTLARNNKQSPLQYVRSHDHLILDSTHSPSELSEIFMPNDTPLITAGIKRRASDSIYENGLNGQQHPAAEDGLPPSIKRPSLTSQNAFLFSAHQSLLLPNASTAIPNSHFFDYNPHLPPNHPPQRLEDNNNSTPSGITRGDEEWRNIHVMLNCILSMVEKTKRALTILQQRNSQDLTNEWLKKQDVSVDLKKAANEIMLQAVRQTEDRVADVRRRAEDAVNDVKRQAVLELQKAVAAAESKANELVAAERAKMEKLLNEARKHAEENTESVDNTLSPPVSAQPAPSQQNVCMLFLVAINRNSESHTKAGTWNNVIITKGVTMPAAGVTVPAESCWNCGRKAHETCSGCSVARYCGPFCQHKDWENHHQICTKDKTRPLRTSTPSTTTLPQQQPSVTHITQSEAVKFKK